MPSSAGDPIARERTRARAARKLLPWVFASAAAAALLVWMAGGRLAGAATVMGAGCLFALFVWSLSVARCPSCGAPLPRQAAEPAATGGGASRCARCGAG